MWNGWPLNRVVILFYGIGLWIDLHSGHIDALPAELHHWSQWLPVIALPVLALNAFTLAFVNHPAIRSIFAILTIIGFIEGIYGFYKHFTGVGKRVDGYRFHNFLVGPPVILPLMVSAICTLALLALGWS